MKESIGKRREKNGCNSVVNDLVRRWSLIVKEDTMKILRMK